MDKPTLNKPFKSSKPGKKMSVYVKTNNKRGYKLIHFGDSSMKDFTQHKDPKRRASYLARAKGIKDKQGNLTWKNKESPNYWSVRVNWGG
tara:strand:+ start:237 stop:506 length:270 start_codon:yes stop_codon:yes gene_type:complete